MARPRSNVHSDMEDSAVRERMLGRHPIITHRYTVATPMIESAYQLFRERVWLRRKGTVLHAETRTGKTWCARAVKELLELEFEDIYAVFLIAKRSSSKRSFLCDLLRACALPVDGTRDQPYVLCERFMLHIQSELARRNGDHFVLIIDEMQLLNADEFNELAAIGNRLESAQISMTTLGFAQPQIQHLLTGLLVSGYRNLVARYLAEQIAFEGCGNAKVLETILDAYDHEKFYPLDSDWTYTRFFYPKAFAAGLRLKTYAEPLWDQLDRSRHTTPLPYVPMEHVARSIESLLVSNRHKDSARFRFQKAHIEKAVAQSELTALQRLGLRDAAVA